MISLHFNVLVSLFEFVPLELIVELDVSDDPKCQDQISDRLFCRGWSLRKVSRYVSSSIKPSGGLFISRTFESWVYFIKRHCQTLQERARDDPSGPA